MKNVLLGIIIFLLVIGIGVLGFNNYKLNADIEELKTEKEKTSEGLNVPNQENEIVTENVDAEGMYNKAISIFPLEMGTDEIKIDDNSYVEVLNYKGDNIFSTNANIAADSFSGVVNEIIDNVIIKRNNKVYARADGEGVLEGGNYRNRYISSEFTKVSQSDNKIEYTVKVKYSSDYDAVNDQPTGESLYREDKFVIVKENGNWLIDHFVVPYFGVSV